MSSILASQGLYYLSKSTLAQNMDGFYEMCEKGAIFFAATVSEKNYCLKHIGEEDEQGLRRVVLEDGPNGTGYIHFIKNTTNLKELFKPFECLYLGEYDPINSYELEGSAHRFIYIGVKK